MVAKTMVFYSLKRRINCQKRHFDDLGRRWETFFGHKIIPHLYHFTKNHASFLQYQGLWQSYQLPEVGNFLSVEKLFKILSHHLIPCGSRAQGTWWENGKLFL